MPTKKIMPISNSIFAVFERFMMLMNSPIYNFVVLISSCTSTSNKLATLTNVAKSGSETLVHHFLTVDGSLSNFSVSYLSVFFFNKY